jgi:hypothetical protein
MTDTVFDNYRSVKFNLDAFALPVNKVSRKKNVIYTAILSDLAGTKNKLFSKPVVNKYGYDTITWWRTYVFAANQSGIYVADQTLNFTAATNQVFPTKLFTAGDRVFGIDGYGKTVIYTIDLTVPSWTPPDVIEGSFFIPDGYGKVLDLGLYRGDLLLICENALCIADKRLNIKYLTDDSGVLAANLSNSDVRFWESDWFSLGYATDTQYLREVFIKTDTAIYITVLSNRTNKKTAVKPDINVQKIKINLRGDVFKIRITVPDGAFTVSDLSAVVGFGRR